MKTNKKLFGFIVSTIVTGFICNNVSANPINSNNAHQNHSAASVASVGANNNIAIDSNFLTISQIDDFANHFEISKYEKELSSHKIHISKHIGMNKEKFPELLESFPYMKAITSYTDQKTANIAIKETIKYNAPKIIKWMNSKRSDKLMIKKEFDTPVGYGIKRKGNLESSIKIATVVLERDHSLPIKFYVRSSYPLIKD